MLTFVMPWATSYLQTKNKKADTGPETTICLNNHSRELSEAYKVPLRSNSKSQSVKDYQAPWDWLCHKKPEDWEKLASSISPSFPTYLAILSQCLSFWKENPVAPPATQGIFILISSKSHYLQALNHHVWRVEEEHSLISQLWPSSCNQSSIIGSILWFC